MNVAQRSLNKYPWKQEIIIEILYYEKIWKHSTVLIHVNEDWKMHSYDRYGYS